MPQTLMQSNDLNELVSMSIKSSIVSANEFDESYTSTHHGMTSAELSLNLTALK